MSGRTIGRAPARKLLIALCTLLVGAGTSFEGRPAAAAGRAGASAPDHCRMVPPEKRVATFRTDHYLTSPGSVFAEALMPGVSQGLTGGLSGVGAVRGYQAADGSEVLEQHLPAVGARAGALLSEKILKPESFGGLPLFLLPEQPKAFCRIYSAPTVIVVVAAGDAMRKIGFPMKIDDYRNGVFETEFVKRDFRIGVWVERYRVTVEATGPLVLVSVKRQVFRGRNPQIGGSNAPTLYTQGISSGHNEYWILTEISQSISVPK